MSDPLAVREPEPWEAPPSFVLSGSIGGGHDSVAAACTDALAAGGSQAVTLNCMELLGTSAQRIGEQLFRKGLSIPPLFDAFHFSQLRSSSRMAEALERASAKRLVPALRERLSEVAGGLLLSVFSTGAGAAGRLRTEEPSWRTVVYCTDATAHRLWIHPGVDRYLVTSPAAAGTVRQFDPFADVVEVPPAVRAPFFAAPPRAAAREALELEAEGPYALVMGGAWGLGSIATTAGALADSGWQVLVVAGSNRKLERRLRADSAGRPGRTVGSVIPFGVTARIPELMAAADVVVTSAGQTCHEARVVGRPLIVMDMVPGHGRENLLAELAKGGALACQPRPEAVVRAAEAALDGALPRSWPWPMASAARWEETFLSAVGDLLKGP
jgi:processive 1,2-diacylglycerol beta-glucosyltransferase